MDEIIIYGLPTKRFRDLKVIVESYLEINNMAIPIRAESRIEKLMDRALFSIPALMYKNQKYHIRNGIEVREQILPVLDKLVNLESDYCSYCGHGKDQLGDLNSGLVDHQAAIQNKMNRSHRA